MSRTADETGIEQDRIRQWFETNLVTEVGTRGLAFRGETTTEGIPNSVVDALETLHLIRAEVRSGQRWYELSHDCFIEPILRANDAWRAKNQVEEVQKREEAIRFQQEAKQAKKLRKLLRVMGAVLFIALFASGFALLQWRRADKAIDSAVEASDKAEKAGEEASNARKVAEERLEKIKNNFRIRYAYFSESI